jgi:DUF3040 family protein
MTMQDPFARMSRRTRWFSLRRGLGLPGSGLARLKLSRPYRPGPGLRASARERRRLARIERALTADMPVLASMFTMFNRLTAGEQPASVEWVPSPARRPRGVHLAVLLALAAIAALCLTLSTQLHSAARSCSGAARMTTSAPVRSPTCHAYATTK